MPSFIDAWEKVSAQRLRHADGTSVLNKNDKREMLDRIGEHTQAGHKPMEAALLSVEAQIAEVDRHLASVHEQAGVPLPPPPAIETTPEPAPPRRAVLRHHESATVAALTKAFAPFPPEVRQEFVDLYGEALAKAVNQQRPATAIEAASRTARLAESWSDADTAAIRAAIDRGGVSAARRMLSSKAAIATFLLLK